MYLFYLRNDPSLLQSIYLSYSKFFFLIDLFKDLEAWKLSSGKIALGSGLNQWISSLRSVRHGEKSTCICLYEKVRSKGHKKLEKKRLILQ